MTTDPTKPGRERKHESWDNVCRECQQDYHDDCKSECGETDCTGPCVCDCRATLTPDEIFKLRRFAASLA